MRELIVVAALGLTIGCRDAPTAPTPGPGSGPRSGAWLGTLIDGANGTGRLRVEVRESMIGDLGLLDGAWTATFAGGAVDTAGDLSGTIAGATVQLTLRPAVPVRCPTPGPLPGLNGSFVALNLTLAGTAISGPYAYQACGTPVTGMLELRKE